MGEGSERGRSPRRAIPSPPFPPAGNGTSNYSSYTPRTRTWPASRERSELRGVVADSTEEICGARPRATQVGGGEAVATTRAGKLAPQQKRARRRFYALSSTRRPKAPPHPSAPAVRQPNDSGTCNLKEMLGGAQFQIQSCTCWADIVDPPARASDLARAGLHVLGQADIFRPVATSYLRDP